VAARAPCWPQTRILEDHTGPVACVSFSRDGGKIATGGGNGDVRLWEAYSGRLLAVVHNGGWVVPMNLGVFR